MAADGSGVLSGVPVSAASLVFPSGPTLFGLDLVLAAGVLAGRETSVIETSMVLVFPSSTVPSDFSPKFKSSQRLKGNLTSKDFLDFLIEACFGVAFFGVSIGGATPSQHQCRHYARELDVIEIIH